MPPHGCNGFDAMSVDVEDWVNATILQETGRVCPPSDAVLMNSEKLLNLFEEHGASATWFFLGEIAEAFPGLVRKVAESGHEIGVHGFHHHQVPVMSRKAFREAVHRAKDAVEQAGGVPALGYRAVDFGINQKTWWALDVLTENGFKYDSSVFPMRTARYGMSGAPTEAHWIRTEDGARIYEIPVTVLKVLGFGVPFAGGGYFRMLPYWFTSVMMKWQHRRASPAVFYLHPCEIEERSHLDGLPPNLNKDEKRQIRKRFVVETRGRRRGTEKLGRLLNSYRFASIADVFHLDQLTIPSA